MTTSPRLLVEPCWTRVDPTGLDAATSSLVGATVAKALTVSADDAWTQRLRRTYHNPMIGVSTLYRADCRAFPTGLLGHVLAALSEVGLTPGLVWAPGTGYLPQVVAVGADSLNAKGHAPRDYQLALVQEAITRGRGIVQAATSAGKTAMIGLLLRALGNPPTLLVVGSRTLVSQTRAEVASWLGAPVGEFTATRRILSPNVVVGLVQSLAAQAGDPEVAEFLRTRQVLVMDECHHAARAAKGAKKGVDTGRIAGGQWYEVAMRCSQASNRYGFSATPLKIGDQLQNMRLLGVTGPLFENGITGTDLIDQGFAARPYVYWAPYSAPKLRSKGLTFAEVTKLGVVECVERNEVVAGAAEDFYREGLKVLVLVEHTAHGRIIESVLRARGVPVTFVHGGLTLEQQEDGLAWLRETGPRVCVSTRVLGEGTNVPSIGAVVYAKAGKAFVALFQGIGRGLRPKGAPGAAGMCFVVIPDDRHHPLLRKHADILRAYLAAEPGYRVALPGQALRPFVRAVLDLEELVEA